LKNEGDGTRGAYVHTIGAAFNRPWFEVKLLRTLGIAPTVGARELSKNPDRMQMLRCQAGIFAPGPDVNEVEAAPGDRGQDQGGAKDLAAPLPATAIDSEHHFFSTFSGHSLACDFSLFSNFSRLTPKCILSFCVSLCVLWD
jgi:hypothetical protein